MPATTAALPGVAVTAPRRGTAGTVLRALRSPIVQFSLSGLLVAALVAAIGMEVGRHIGTDTAIVDAKQASRLAGQGLVAPAIRDGLSRGDPEAIAAVDAVVRTHILRDGVVRVKLWAADGRIVYSDQRELIGGRFQLGAEERAAVTSGAGVEAEVSELARPENRFEGRGERRLLEVYLPIRGADGRPYLFEVYKRFSAVADGGRRVWTAFAPALLVLLALLQLVNLPLARSFARRLRRASEERAALLQRAVDASDTERRAIAADLHDGVVQDLVSVALGLEARANELDAQGHEASSGALREGARQTREGVRSLRTLLVDIYPPRLRNASLAAALEDLAATQDARGVPTSVSCDPALTVTDGSAQLLYRCVQEALRNTAKHAGPCRASIELSKIGSDVVAQIRDDGAGFDPNAAAARRGDGHIGLRALTDLVRDAGGRLEISSSPGRGTVVAVCVPG
jgi:two-component system, NarL family, sensor kinase